jgi:hypothetical protein
MKIIHMTGDMPPCCCGAVSECGCPDLHTTDDLVLTIISPDCSPIDGITLPLTWDGEKWTGQLSGDYCLYGGAAVWCDTENPTGSCQDYLLLLGLTISGCPIEPVLEKPPDRCFCSPLSLEYDFTMSEAAPGVCPCRCETFPAELTVRVTKAE